MKSKSRKSSGARKSNVKGKRNVKGKSSGKGKSRGKSRGKSKVKSKSTSHKSKDVARKTTATKCNLNPRFDKSKSARVVPSSHTRVKSKTKSTEGPHATHASINMSLGELQCMAKSAGIPFGGLNKSRLVHKINNYS
tara:strand:+ start:10676 stop:11086 length:411 start_codon:yes stop_codon:yes gene_type:complete